MAQIITKKPKSDKIITTKPLKASISDVKKPSKLNNKPAKISKEVITPKIVADVPVLARYINKNLKVSPRKLRLVVTNVKKLDPVTAVNRLKFTNTNAARLLCKCLEDAIASAKHNYKLLPSTLKFNQFRVDEGMKIKRMDKSHGSRFARGIIQKRHSRLIIILSGTIQG